jgi:hypothetical protein
MNKDIRQLLSIMEEGGKSQQKITVPHFWRGGTNGDENEWNQPMNWYNRRVPGWFDVVVIAGAFTRWNCYPVINEFANDIAQLIIEPGGRLVISEHGKLSIDGLAKKGLGIVNEGEIYIEGELSVHRTTMASVRNIGTILNSGSFAIDKSEARGIIHTETGKFENFGELLFL